MVRSLESGDFEESRFACIMWVGLLQSFEDLKSKDVEYGKRTLPPDYNTKSS